MEKKPEKRRLNVLEETRLEIRFDASPPNPTPRQKRKRHVGKRIYLGARIRGVRKLKGKRGETQEA